MIKQGGQCRERIRSSFWGNASVSSGEKNCDALPHKFDIRPKVRRSVQPCRRRTNLSHLPKARRHLPHAVRLPPSHFKSNDYLKKGSACPNFDAVFFRVALFCFVFFWALEFSSVAATLEMSCLFFYWIWPSMLENQRLYPTMFSLAMWCSLHMVACLSSI
jgi:hypothetical protein